MAWSKLKGLRAQAELLTKTTTQTECPPLGPPPGLEDVLRIEAVAGEADHQALAEMQTKCTQLQAEIRALEAMGGAAIHHAIEEQERLQSSFNNFRNFTVVETTEEQHDMTNPLDRVYEAVVTATRREMCLNTPAWVSRAEVQRIADMDDTDFDEALDDWVKLSGMVMCTCIALQDFPPEWRVEET